MSEKIILVPPDPEWPRKFRIEKQSILAALKGRRVHIRHVGSTAIPGIAAKPVIDIIIGCASMKQADTLLPLLCAIGYETSARFNAKIGERRFLKKRRNRKRTHHVHVIVHRGELWRNYLKFRNTLRKDPALAKRYARMKIRMARKHVDDRIAYTEAKTPFVKRVLKHS
jgi:GrpB-like predicted nucleotidyltransferase (UPF0157 family)